MANGNLGIKQKDLDDSGIGIAIGMDPEDRDKERDNKIVFPSFNLTNKHIEAAGLTDAQIGDIYEFTARVKVDRLEKKSPDSKSYGGNRVELEVQDISDVTQIEGDEEESEEKKDADSKLGFDTGGMRKGGGAMSPKAAGLKLK